MRKFHLASSTNLVTNFF